MSIRTLLLIASTPFFVDWFASCAYSEPNKVEYELQERCGKRAAEVFKSEYTQVQNTDEGQMLFNYRNHYSATLNKCFFLEMSSIIATKANPVYTAQMFRLFDINDNNEYGNFYKRSDANVPQECNVFGKSCSSEAEWNALIAPYMEDAQ
jgi:hypothetical protein